MAEMEEDEGIVRAAIRRYWLAGYNQADTQAFLEVNEGIQMSLRQIKYNINRMGLSITNRDSDLDIRQAIKGELQTAGRIVGYRTMWYHLRQKGLNASRNKVRQMLALEDPDGVERRKKKRFKRGMYHSNGPNQTWHIDGHDKLSPYGINISGCIDGYSRKIIWMEVASTNSNPAVIASYFLKAVEKIGGCPLTVRADAGTENGEVAAMQCFLRRNGTDSRAGLSSFIYGKSTSNQRIEQFWSILLKNYVEWWRQYFSEMADQGLFQHRSQEDICLVRFAFLSLIRTELDSTADVWNRHRIRSQRNLRVPCGIPNILYRFPQRYDGTDHLQQVPDNEVEVLKEHTAEPDVVGDTVLHAYFNYVVANNQLSWPPATLAGARTLYEQIRLHANYA